MDVKTSVVQTESQEPELYPVPDMDPDPTKNGMTKVKEAKDPNSDNNFLDNKVASNIKKTRY